jgi:RNA polymerase sigma-70 factor (sigma-E family)
VNASVYVVEEAYLQPARLEELYVRHAPAAVGMAYLLTGNREAAEDLVQEAFIRAAGRFQHLRDAEAFPSYLRRTVVNLHLSRLRRIRVERSYLARQQGAPVGSSMPDITGRADVWAGVQRLPARQRAAIVLRYYEDLSERESAEVLRCSMSAMKSLVTRAMRTLRDQMGSEGQ